MAEDTLSEADYLHGASELATVFEDFLLRQAVEFEFVGDRVIMRVDKTEIVFLTQPEWLSSEVKKMMDNPISKKMLVRAVNVRKG